MAHSLGPPARGPSGAFFDARADTQFTIESGKFRMVQRLTRDGISAAHPVAYSIGSGTHAIGYIIQIGSHLFQSPLCYYAHR
ncbi:MAG: hypothetical protein ACRD3O_17150, partial [Terriglobia bacterium]